MAKVEIEQKKKEVIQKKIWDKVFVEEDLINILINSGFTDDEIHIVLEYINHTTKYGEYDSSAIEEGVRKGNTEIVKLLLFYGCHKRIIYYSKWEELIKNSQNKEIETLLIDYRDKSSLQKFRKKSGFFSVLSGLFGKSSP